MRFNRTSTINQGKHKPNSFHSFFLSILLVLLVLVLGPIGFLYVEQCTVPPAYRVNNFIDALYFSIVTLTTTGFGDIVPHSSASKLYVIFLLIFGVLTLTWALANAVAFIVEGHLSEVVRMKKMEKNIQSLKNHYIICGLGRVGREVVSQFRINSLDYAIIDKSKENLDEFLHDDELRVIGDATQDESLLEANIKAAKGLIACCPSDAENVFTILTAKGLNPHLFVISRGQEERSRTKLIQAGANRVVMPSHLGGMRLAAMALRPAIVDFLDQTIFVSEDQEPMLLEEVLINENNPLIGKMLRETNIKSGTEVMIMGIKDTDGKMVLNPPSNFVIRMGQVLIGLGRPSDFQKLSAMLNL